MKIRNLHPWNVSYREAVKIQDALRRKLRFTKLKKKPTLIAGADVSCARNHPQLYAAIVVLSLKDFSVVEVQTAQAKTSFPYIPGLLSFRELPILCKAFEKLELTPDAVICDGQGIAHPRGLGLAAHLGLILGIPTVGCAKSRLVGEHREVGAERWSRAPLRYQGNIIGSVVRSRRAVKPLYISPGHKIDIPGSIQMIKWTTGKYRLPEPTRQAHITVNEYRRQC